MPKHPETGYTGRTTTAATKIHHPAAIITTAAPTTEPTNIGEQKSTRLDRIDSTGSGSHPTS